MTGLSSLSFLQFSSRKMNATLVVLIAMICAALANVLEANWESDNQRASTEIANISAAVSDELLRNIELFDLSIQGVIDGLQNPAVMSASKEVRQIVLFERAATVPSLAQILLIGPNGDLIATSRTPNPPARSYADRDYFRIHQQRADFGIFVSRPLVSRTDGARMFAVSRRINNPDGSFGGVVAGTFLIDYVHDLFLRMRLGAHGSITLFRNDGSVMAREPYDPSQAGTRNFPTSLFERASRSPDGEFIGNSSVDGVRRLYHFNRIGKLPLVTSVGLAMDDIHSEWWRRALLISGIVAASCLLIVLLNFRLGRELRKRAEAEQALTMLVDKDGLTGLGNRRCFDRVTQAEWSRAGRQGLPMALLMIDADHFKAYNDCLGHAAGDEALRQIARCLEAQTRRPGDLAARYGGEEFAVVLPGLNRLEACRVAEAIRLGILQLAISHPGSELGQFTVSIGCASHMPRESGTVDDLIRAADEALYRSKLAGRNRVSSEEPARPPLKLAS